MGRSADLPIFNQIWRHVRQSCILREQTLAFVEKNEFLPARKFVCEVREFPRFPFSLKNRVFQRIEPRDLSRGFVMLRAGYRIEVYWAGTQPVLL